METFVGSRTLRWTGSRLENSQAWVRLNQFLVAIFPAFDNEFAFSFAWLVGNALFERATVGPALSSS